MSITPHRFTPKARLAHKPLPRPKGQSWRDEVRAIANDNYHENEAAPYRAHLKGMTPEKIEVALQQIDPENHLPYGTRFVRRMLETPEGSRMLERFTNRALAIMDVENGLDIRQDFTAEQCDMLFSDKADWVPLAQRAANENGALAETPGMNGSGLSRRAALLGGMFSGAGLFWQGAVGGAAYLAGTRQQHAPDEKEPWKRALQEMQERVHAMESLVLMTIGAHYGYDVYVEGKRITEEEIERRVKQVEDVVYDLAQLTREQRPRSAAERYRGIAR